MTHDWIESFKRALIVLAVLTLAITTYSFIIEPLINNVTADPVEQVNDWLDRYGVCTEDMDCWDCKTMGNRICGGTAT